ncbi:hypothetical protein WN55_07294 [Dufourea novaeangliae]|uniref:Uncharacterized protein n=1 Tax=Dufourea novaeangliae TaxID=178035 RepID=A0A154P4G9_DUFNO|nr:hypothetical protein WN55_07294 [Dufourea novaeangliae]
MKRKAEGRFVLGLLVDSSERLPSRPCLRREDIRWSVKDVYMYMNEEGFR